MVSVEELQEEIARLENGDINQAVCNKLAALYCVLDHQPKVARYSHSGSEFAQVMYSVPFDKALPVLEEHFEAIKVLYPKEYKALIEKIKAL